jgi:hypothetical protein
LESRIIEQLVWQWWMDKSRGQWKEVSDQKRQEPRLARRDVAEDRDSLNPRDRKGCEVGGAPQGCGRVQAADFAKARQGGQATARQASDKKNKQQILKGSDKSPVMSSQKNQLQIPRRMLVASSLGMTKGWHGAQRPWAKYRVARFLGVSHTWVNKLVKKFEADPDRMRRKMKAFAPASIEKLERAREETRVQRERGYLRGPIRYRRVKVTLYGKKRKVMVPTGRTAVTSGEWLVTSKQRQLRRSQQYSEPVRNDNIPLAYRELPAWARGALLPGEAGTLRPCSGQATGRGKSAFAKNRSGETGTPRPVPFAFRRRRR